MVIGRDGHVPCSERQTQGHAGDRVTEPGGRLGPGRGRPQPPRCGQAGTAPVRDGACRSMNSQSKSRSQRSPFIIVRLLGFPANCLAHCGPFLHCSELSKSPGLSCLVRHQAGRRPVSSAPSVLRPLAAGAWHARSHRKGPRLTQQGCCLVLANHLPRHRPRGSWDPTSLPDPSLGI